MKSFVRTLLLLAVVVVLAMGSATAQGQTSVGAIVDSMRHEIIDIAKFIHANPSWATRSSRRLNCLQPWLTTASSSKRA